MKILHTADWHLGNTFHGHNRLLEHRHFLAWLLNVLKEQQPDAMIISGDVFDSANPSAAAEELLYDFLLKATLAVPGLPIATCRPTNWTSCLHLHRIALFAKWRLPCQHVTRTGFRFFLYATATKGAQICL